MEEHDDPCLKGLVRVVALDGSVWWVRPEHVLTVSQRENAVLEGFELIKEFYKLYEYH